MSAYREAIAAAHRDAILKASEQLFAVKGYEQTTIDDISKAAQYSRRTIYAYFQSKEDILAHSIEQGLIQLLQDVKQCMSDTSVFSMRFMSICNVIRNYHLSYPYSSSYQTKTNTSVLSEKSLNDTEQNIIDLGEKINAELIHMLEKAKQDGEVRQDVISEVSVYILMSSIQAVIQLECTKGKYLCAHLNISSDVFLDYAFHQIMDSIV